MIEREIKLCSGAVLPVCTLLVDSFGVTDGIRCYNWRWASYAILEFRRQTALVGKTAWEVLTRPCVVQYPWVVGVSREAFRQVFRKSPCAVWVRFKGPYDLSQAVSRKNSVDIRTVGS